MSKKPKTAVKKKIVHQVSFDAFTYQTHSDFKNIKGAVLSLGGSKQFWHITIARHIQTEDGLCIERFTFKPSEKVSLSALNPLIYQGLAGEQSSVQGNVISLQVTARII